MDQLWPKTKKPDRNRPKTIKMDWDRPIWDQNLENGP